MQSKLHRSKMPTVHEMSSWCVFMTCNHSVLKITDLSAHICRNRYFTCSHTGDLASILNVTKKWLKHTSTQRHFSLLHCQWPISCQHCHKRGRETYTYKHADTPLPELLWWLTTPWRHHPEMQTQCDNHHWKMPQPALKSCVHAESGTHTHTHMVTCQLWQTLPRKVLEWLHWCQLVFDLIRSLISYSNVLACCCCTSEMVAAPARSCASIPLTTLTLNCQTTYRKRLWKYRQL